MFSGGITSWATARWTVERYGAADTTLLFADTRIEDVDLYRFNDDAARMLGVELVTVADGRNPFEVFRDERYLGNTRKAPCSKLLKQRVCRRWMSDNTDPADTTIYVGIDWTETHRLPAVESGWSPWSVRAPLTEPPYTDKSALIDEAQRLGLTPPRLYGMGFAHNNCGGICVRAGQGQWARLLETMPERYGWAEAQETALRSHLGKDVAILRDRRGGTVKPLTLRAFRERVQNDEVDRADLGGCGCFTA